MNLDWNQMMVSYAETPYAAGALDAEGKARWQSFLPVPSNGALPHWDQSTQGSQTPSTTGDEQTPADYPDSDWCETFVDPRLDGQSHRASSKAPSPSTSTLQIPKPPSPGEENVGDRSKKRREQNRNAQRAYRERKEKYIQNLLKHIEEMNKNHIRLSDSYEALKQEATRLQAQVDSLKTKLEVWNKAQLVVLKLPDSATPDASMGISPETLAAFGNSPRTMELPSEF